MRAWLLLLAVLATFKPIVQVASTEDITSSFIQAISSPSIEQQKKVIELGDEGGARYEKSRDTRKLYNTQQLETESKRKTITIKTKTKINTTTTALSPVIDITSLSVTKTTSAKKERSRKSATTAIATIFSYKSSDSDTYNNNNNNNNLTKISAKDNQANKSEKTSNALKSIDNSEVRQNSKSNKQNKNKTKIENYNEVNEKSANNILANTATTTKHINNIVRTEETQKNKVQHLENTSNKINHIEKTRTKNTSDLEEISIVNSVIDKEEENIEDEKPTKMAINENKIATTHEMPQQHKKRQRHHKQQKQQQRQQQLHKHHRHHNQQQQQHQDINKQEQPQQQQHTHQMHQQKHPHHNKMAHSAAKATEELSATEERLAKEAFSATETLSATTESLTIETPSATNDRLAIDITQADETTTSSIDNRATHIEAAKRLAQDSAIALESNRIAQSTSATTSTSTSAPASPTFASNAANDDVNSENEPATYSNKEIIGDKLKPDPSTLVQIENSLLSLFNMKRPPKIDRSKIIIPEAMKQLYAQIMGHELDTVATMPRPSILSRTANTVRSFTHIESKIDDRFPHHHRFRLYFDVKSIPTEEKLKAAELQLSRDAINDAVLSERLANRTRYQVLAYDITRVGIRGKREPSYKLLDNKLVQLNSTEIVSLNVQSAVNRWLATPKKNYGLLIEVRTTPALKPAPHHHVRLRRSTNELHDSWQHKQPVLYAYTDDGKHKSRPIRDTSSRSKRAGGHHRRGHRRKNSDEICRRHSLYVDFADVGWSDWIVAPPGYDAFYCQGKCPFPLAEHMNSTNHAVVQTLVNNLNPGKVPKACCVPTQLEGISMLYLNDQNTVVLKNYQDMTVVGCGCR